jgi:hypothetical protein
MRMAVYYEDRVTGSIYSVRELSRASRWAHMPLDTLSRGLKRLPKSTCQRIDEAEAVAGKAAEE